MKQSKILFFALALFFSSSAMAQITEPNENGKKLDTKKMETKDYLPEIHGTIRAKYEYEPNIKSSRFQVRNARFSLTGNVHPIVAYKAEIDLSDEGSIRMLDAYTRLFPVKGLSFTMGQMRVPFTIDAHRSPHQQYFPNRSFIAKQVGNVRDVGATIGYNMKEGFPFTIEAGAFNGSGLTNQKVWHKDLNYSVKAQFFPINNSNLTLSMQTVKPDIARIYMYDIGGYYNFYGFHIEGEYLYKHYDNNAFKNVHAVNSFINYDMKLRKVFSKISYLLRYDMMTDHSRGVADEKTKALKIDDYKRHRLTGGITLSIGKKAFVADLRLNYEKYFYRKNAIPNESEQDKLVIELMTRF